MLSQPIPVLAKLPPARQFRPMDVIARAVSEGDSVQLVGFGSFSQGQRAARTGRNPTTGAEIVIAAAKTVKFSAGKAFKDAVNAP